MIAAVRTLMVFSIAGLLTASARAAELELTHQPDVILLPGNGPIDATIYIGPTTITVVNHGQVSTYDTPFHGKLALIASDYSDSITVVGQPLLWLAVALHDGNDHYIDYTSSPGFVSGGSGNDDITSGDADDRVRGGDGDDVLRTGAGNDQAEGGAGDDLIYLGPGNDAASGGEGNDDMFGEAGNDVLYGSHGVDLVDGGPGADDLYGYGPEKHFENKLLLPSNTINPNGPQAYPDGKTDMLVGGSGPDVFFDRFWEWKMVGRYGYRLFYETEAISTFQAGEDIRVDSYVPRPRRPVATLSKTSYYTK